MLNCLGWLVVKLVGSGENNCLDFDCVACSGCVSCFLVRIKMLSAFAGGNQN